MNTFPSRQVREHERIYQRFRTVASLDPTISTAGEAAIDHWAMEQLLALSGGIIRHTPKVREYWKYLINPLESLIHPWANITVIPYAEA